MSGKLSDIITLNEELKNGPSPVALIIGGTSGIGLAILRALVKHTTSPRIYFSGRNKTAAETIIADANKTNANAKVVFLPADVYLLENLVKLTRSFIEEELKEEGINSEADVKLNLLVTSTGTFNQNTTPTKENLQPELASRHYSRVLAINQLLPALQNATNTPIGARVISVFAAGQEGVLDTEDVPMRDPKNRGFINLAFQGATLQTLMTEELAERFPSIAFFHIFPGTVMTGIFRELPIWAKVLVYIVTPILNLISVDADEVGERLLRLLTDDQHKTGAHLLNYDGNLNRDWRVNGFRKWKAGSEEWNAKRKEWRDVAWNDFEKIAKEVVPDAYRDW